jgi:hypothetical protein
MIMEMLCDVYGSSECGQHNGMNHTNLKLRFKTESPPASVYDLTHCSKQLPVLTPNLNTKRRALSPVLHAVATASKI